MVGFTVIVVVFTQNRIKMVVPLTYKLHTSGLSFYNKVKGVYNKLKDFPIQKNVKIVNTN